MASDYGDEAGGKLLDWMLVCGKQNVNKAARCI